MRNFMSRMNDNLRHFMYGRYGVDSFGRFLIGAMFVLIVLSIFIRSWILQVLIWGVLIYSYFRMFSRNIPKRYAENQKFLSVTGGVRKFLRRKEKAMCGSPARNAGLHLKRMYDQRVRVQNERHQDERDPVTERTA